MPTARAPGSRSPSAVRKPRLRTEHDELSELFASLASAVGRIETSDPDEHAWAEAMGLLGVLEGFLLKHLVREEENGYLAEALAAAPRLTRRANRLLQQHNKICSALDSLISHARATRDTRKGWEVVGAEASDGPTEAERLIVLRCASS